MAFYTFVRPDRLEWVVGEMIDAIGVDYNPHIARTPHIRRAASYILALSIIPLLENQLKKG